jgi:L-alanine-DL-glutamate epimerase-like enolase superfamily enzyme
MRIAGIDAALCSFRLRRPLRLTSSVAFSSREYVALRLRTDEPEIVGYAVGHVRDTPLLEGLRLLAPQLVGGDALARSALIASLGGSLGGGRAALLRPLSMLEMALWDVVSKHARLPLHLLLGGGGRRPAPALAVAYYLDDEGEDAVLEQIGRLETEGFSRIKLMIGARPAAWMRRFFGRVKDQLSAETLFSIDLHYSVPTLDEGIRLLHALDDLELAFVEDPFEPARWRELAALRARCRTPLACGEAVVTPLEYRDVLEGASVLRVDPATCGGFAPAMTGIQLAEVAGATVLPHGFAGTNAQLAGAFAVVSAVEVIPAGPGGDDFELLMESPFELHDGAVHLDREPGAGLRLDWDAVCTAASSSWSTCC